MLKLLVPLCWLARNFCHHLLHSHSPAAPHVCLRNVQVAFVDGKPLIEGVGSSAGIVTPDIAVGDKGRLRCLLLRCM